MQYVYVPPTVSKATAKTTRIVPHGYTFSVSAGPVGEGEAGGEGGGIGGEGGEGLAGGGGGEGAEGGAPPPEPGGGGEYSSDHVWR